MHCLYSFIHSLIYLLIHLYDYFHQSLQKYRRQPQMSAGCTDSLGRKFESVWRDRTPIEAEFDDLVGGSHLTWENDQVFSGVGADDEGSGDEVVEGGKG